MAKKKAPTAKKEAPLSHPSWKRGTKRYFLSTSTDFVLQWTSQDVLLAAVAVVIALVTRLWAISKPPVVLFDEVHTVRHVNKYIDGLYFHDVSPPLAHLVYTFMAYLVGYRGDAPLSKTGEDYSLTSFPYVALRVATVLMATAVVPLLYTTLRACSVRPLVAFVSCVLFNLENIVVLDSRIFMPDTLFLLGVALAVYAFKRFDIEKPFGLNWFRYLALTGVALGLTVSTKWAGLATIVWILTLSVVKLWFVLGDIEISDCKVTQHFIFRGIALVVIPLVIYFGTFVVHFKLLTQFNEDASLLSTHFQRELLGNDVSDIPKYATWGSTVTIRHSDSMGGYLHSHVYKYKSGSKNQQVTVFGYKDFNNEWVIEPAKKLDSDDPRIRRDAEIHLRHKITGALLRVDDFKPPISEQDYDSEVSCFGDSQYQGNDTEVFKVRFDESEKYLRSTDMKFWLFNTNKRCTVLSHDLKLPSWGFNQQEVICIETPTMERAKFTVETIKHPKDLDYSKVPELSEKLERKPLSLLSKFIETNRLMLRLLKNIKVSNESSKAAWTWPFDLKGVKFSNRTQSAIYVIGNPVTFLLVLVLLPVAVIVSITSLIRGDYTHQLLNYRYHSLSFVLGWIVHYIPYVAIEGEYFLQYYIPALYFGVLLIGVTFEYLLTKNHTLAIGLLGVCTTLSYYFFTNVSPLIYATPWTVELCESAKLFSSWDFYCDAYKTVIS